MDLQTFRRIVDGAASGIATCNGDLKAEYDYVGLQHGSSYSRAAVSDSLYARIRDSFTSGLSAVWRVCESLRKDLIREHVLGGAPLDPYFEVLRHLADAVRAPDSLGEPPDADWAEAIRGAVDHAQIQSFDDDRERIYVRDFMVARAARYLRDSGFAIHLEPGVLRLEEAGEAAVVAAIEELIITMGGLNVARRIFASISSTYDINHQRYNLVRHVTMTGGGEPQIPWGYLVQLSAKHLRGRKPYENDESRWKRLCALSQAYAAVLDVQPYSPNFWVKLNSVALLRHLQEMAVYDTLFCIPQLRPSDVSRIARGMFDWLDVRAPMAAGYSIDQVLGIIGFLLSPARDVRGPVIVDEIGIVRACPSIPRKLVTQILDDVLSHPIAGANRKFSRPMDAPLPDDPDLKDAGHDFFLRPLLRHSGRRFVLLDRSVCAPACLEALLGCLRQEIKGLDEKVGASIERFLEAEFALHGVKVTGGDYDIDGAHGECDLIIDAHQVVVLAEVKKKPLTRRARAGSDVHLLLDLAGSLLAAQAQAGWHEVRLRRLGYLDLKRNGITARLELNGREVERVAVSLFDFGSFQDRILLTQFLETNMNMKFTSTEARLSLKFDEINHALSQIREQVAALHPGEPVVNRPFFHCWFLSVPQLLILLDGVTDSDGFKDALWKCRHIVTGSSDLYFDLAYRKGLGMRAAAKAG
jgi:Holliday junction resolvase-like predicted endonuclease